MIVPRAARWFDDRLGAAPAVRRALRKAFPDHWSFMLGEIALYSFLILVLTGVFLTMFFRPELSETVYQGSYEPLRGTSVSAAYDSVMRLSFDVRAGLLMRQMHHWAALIFVAAIVAHLLRIFFTGAFRRPREINWMIGLTLLLLAMVNGFTGYSLPHDLLSDTGLRVMHSIVLSIPIMGTWMASLIFGGEFASEDIIGRLYALHVFVVPGVMGALVALHLAVLWRQKHTQLPGPGRDERNVVGDVLWPTYAAKSLGLLLLVGAAVSALGGLAQINPVWVWGPAIPGAEAAPVQPDWYLGWIEGALRLFPAWELRAFGYTVPNPFYPAVLLPAVTFGVAYLWPFLEARVTGDRSEHHLLDRPRDHPVRTAIGAGVVAFYGVLLLAGSNDLIARWLGVPVGAVTWTLRIAALVAPPVAALLAHRIARARRSLGGTAETAPPGRQPATSRGEAR